MMFIEKNTVFLSFFLICRLIYSDDSDLVRFLISKNFKVCVLNPIKTSAIYLKFHLYIIIQLLLRQKNNRLKPFVEHYDYMLSGANNMLGK